MYRTLVHLKGSLSDQLDYRCGAVKIAIVSYFTEHISEYFLLSSGYSSSEDIGVF